MKDTESEKRLVDSIIAPAASISQAMAQLERAGTGALFDRWRHPASCAARPITE